MTSVQTGITLNEKPVFIPEGKQRAAIMQSLSPDQMPNSYTCPLGYSHGTAFVMMRKSELDAIKDEREFTLEFKAVWENAEEIVKITKLYLIQATRLSVGEPDQEDAPYLLELADGRWQLERWSDSGDVLANIRSAAQDLDFLGGTKKTWNEFVEELWETMPQLGDYPEGEPAEEGGDPEDPVSSDGVPEGFDVRGENSWRMLNDVLEHLGMAVAYDPVNAAYSLVTYDSGGQELPDLYTVRLTRDLEPIENNATRAPETIRVYFPRWYKGYGQEEDTEIDGWQTNDAATFLDVPTQIEGVVGGTIVQLWDDLYATRDQDGELDNEAELQERADNRAEAWLDDSSIAKAQSVHEGYLKELLPGSRIKSVQWRSTGRGPETMVTALSGQITAKSQRPNKMPAAQEEWTTLDLSRRSFPNWARLPNVVQVTTSSANADGVFPGFVYRVDGDIAGSGTLKKYEECWIRFIDNHATAGGELSATASDFFSGRLSGVAESTDESGIDLTGTLTATTGSDAITGNGTAFESELNEGDRITIDGTDYTIEEVVDDENLTLTEDFAGASDDYPVEKSATIRPLYVARRGLPPTTYGEANENWRKSGDDGSGSFTGTITAVNGSDEIEGVGTLFVTELRLGMTLLIDGDEYNIIAIDAESGVAAITLSEDFTGASAGGYPVQTPALTSTPTTPWIRVNPTSDVAGTTTDYTVTNIVFWANFYAPTVGNGSAEDPNVEAGQIIAYHGGTDGQFVTQGYYDGKIGDAIFQTKTFDEKQGWKLMDGFRNSASVGGSGIDISCRFPRGSHVSDPTPAEDPDTPGTVDALHAGGQKDHYHNVPMITTSINVIDASPGGEEIFVLPEDSINQCSSTNKDQSDCDCATPPECECEGTGNPCKLPIEWQHLYYMERVDNSEGFTPP